MRGEVAAKQFGCASKWMNWKGKDRDRVPGRKVPGCPLKREVQTPVFGAPQPVLYTITGTAIGDVRREKVICFITASHIYGAQQSHYFRSRPRQQIIGFGSNSLASVIVPIYTSASCLAASRSSSMISSETRASQLSTALLEAWAGETDFRVALCSRLV